MARDLFQRTIDFLRAECKPYSRSFSSACADTAECVAGVNEVRLFTTILEALLDKQFNRERLVAEQPAATAAATAGVGAGGGRTGKEQQQQHQQQGRAAAVAVSLNASPTRASTGIGSKLRSVSTSSQQSSTHSDILPANYVQSIRLYFIYAYAWAFGSNLSAEYAIRSRNCFPSVLVSVHMFSLLQLSVSIELIDTSICDALQIPEQV